MAHTLQSGNSRRGQRAIEAKRRLADEYSAPGAELLARVVERPTTEDHHGVKG